jgi:hypothetical protein
MVRSQPLDNGIPQPDHLCVQASMLLRRQVLRRESVPIERQITPVPRRDLFEPDVDFGSSLHGL